MTLANIVQGSACILTNDHEICSVLPLNLLVLCNNIDILAFDFGRVLYGQALYSVR